MKSLVQSFKNKYFFTRLSILLLSILFCLLLNNTAKRIDSVTKNLLREISFKQNVDSNIVLLKITKADIEKLGGWPIDRKIYAMLLGDLSKFNPKSIGLEVLLSGSKPNQTVYDSFLNATITKAGNVVLSSLILDLDSTSNGFTSDSIFYPPIKSKYQTIKTGHLNYFANSGLQIPTVVQIGNKQENCFSLSMLKGTGNLDNPIQINMFTWWNEYQSYTLTEFLKMFENQNPELNSLKDKYILIGVTDKDIAQGIQYRNHAYIPGIGFHAIALDNIKNNLYWNNNYFTFSYILFLLYFVILILAVKSKRLLNIYLWSVLTFAIFSYSCTNLFFINIAYSAFIFPIFLLLLLEVYLRYNK